MPLPPTKDKMQLIRRLDRSADAPVALAIGNFDGLHLGHRAVIETMLADARAQKLVPSVLTFEPHPRRYFAPDEPVFRLESLSQKLQRLRDWSVARVYMPRFDAAFAAQSAAEFLQHVLQQSIGAKTVVTGDNFAFGRGRGGDTKLLQQWGAANGVTIHLVPAVVVEGEICSSSAVRAALARGDMAHAAALLGRPYAMRGWVRHGDARGRQLGFPTANITLPEELKLPAYGVYAVRAAVENGAQNEVLNGVANLGVRPSVGKQTRAQLEVHLFDFNRDIYGARLHVELVKMLRPEKKFESLEALKKQIAQDCDRAQTLLSI